MGGVGVAAAAEPAEGFADPHPVADRDPDAAGLQVAVEGEAVVAEGDDHVVAAGRGGGARRQLGLGLGLGQAVDDGDHLADGRRVDPGAEEGKAGELVPGAFGDAGRWARPG